MTCGPECCAAYSGGSTYPVSDGVPIPLTEPLRSEVERKTGHRTQFAEYQTKGTKAVARLLDRLTPQAGVVLDLGSGRALYLDVLRGDVICVDLFRRSRNSARGAGLTAGSMPSAPGHGAAFPRSVRTSPLRRS